MKKIDSSTAFTLVCLSCIAAFIFYQSSNGEIVTLSPDSLLATATPEEVIYDVSSGSAGVPISEASTEPTELPVSAEAESEEASVLSSIWLPALLSLVFVIYLIRRLFTRKPSGVSQALPGQAMPDHASQAVPVEQMTFTDSGGQPSRIKTLRHGVVLGQVRQYRTIETTGAQMVR